MTIAHSYLELPEDLGFDPWLVVQVKCVVTRKGIWF